jgi:hypothetical protein
MATQKSSAHPAHPPEDHDDTVEAHYACLERLRPHACVDGTVYAGVGEVRRPRHPSPLRPGPLRDAGEGLQAPVLTAMQPPPGPEYPSGCPGPRL